MNDRPYRKYKCRFCQHVYDEALGDDDTGVAPGTYYDDLPDDWACPQCGAAKADYDLIDDD